MPAGTPEFGLLALSVMRAGLLRPDMTDEQVVGVMHVGHVRGMKDAPVAEGSTIITYPTFNGAMVGKQALSKEMDTFVAELCNQDLERDQAQEVSPALMATLQEKGYKAAPASAVQSG